MKQLFILSGENIDLAREEAVALCGAKKYETDNRVLVLDMSETKVSECQKPKVSEHAQRCTASLTYAQKPLVFDTNKTNIEKRLAYARKICMFLFKCREKELTDKIKNYDWQKIYKKNFCVRIDNLKAEEIRQSEKELAGFVWNKLTNPKVELETPATRIEFIFTEKNVYCGLFEAEIKKDFMQRRAHLRPELHPSSLSPKLARACINLTGIEKGTVLDPFCGSGGILIEAGFMGFKSVGCDIDAIMLKKAKTNLDFYKIKNYELKQQDATKITKKFPYIVTDLPYGKNTKNIEKDLYERFLNNLRKILKNRAVVIFPDWVDYKKLIKKTRLKMENEFSYYVHKSMTKKIVVLSK